MLFARINSYKGGYYDRLNSFCDYHSLGCILLFDCFLFGIIFTFFNTSLWWPLRANGRFSGVFYFPGRTILDLIKFDFLLKS